MNAFSTLSLSDNVLNVLRTKFLTIATRLCLSYPLPFLTVLRAQCVKSASLRSAVSNCSDHVGTHHGSCVQCYQFDQPDLCSDRKFAFQSTCKRMLLQMFSTTVITAMLRFVSCLPSARRASIYLYIYRPFDFCPGWQNCRSMENNRTQRGSNGTPAHTPCTHVEALRCKAA